MDSRSTSNAARDLESLFRAGSATGLGDRVLLERFAERRDAGDAAAEQAFAVLVERHGPMVLRVCRAVLGDRHDAEDAFQATFLVLASRARSIRRGDSVGAWLHGVALRVASRERRRAASRRQREQRAAAMNPTPIAGSAGAERGPDDVERVLHEEVGRLPEKYRRPVVLCYLEGLTHDQAADQLGWPVGTVRRRLAGARDRLRGRLARRGATGSLFPAGLMSEKTFSVGESASVLTAVPDALVDATVRGAMHAGLGTSLPAGMVSAEAIALTKGVLRIMTTTKLTALAVTLAFVGLLTTGVALMAYPHQQAGSQRAPAAVKAEEPRRPPDSGRSLEEQLEPLIRAYEDGIDSNRKVSRGMRGGGAEKKDQIKAQIQANTAQLVGIERQLLELAARHPRTGAAEQALILIVSSVPFGPESRRAWELLARDAARSDRLKQVITPVITVHWASQAVEDLLQAASEQNPYREIRGLACFWLAEVLRARAQSLRLWPFQPPGLIAGWRERFLAPDIERVLKQDPLELEHRAGRLYDRVIADYPFVGNNDRATAGPPRILGRPAALLAEVARVHRDDLTQLSPGKLAPEIEGVDLDGKPMKLSDFRGKVVVLSFRGSGPQLAGIPAEQATAAALANHRRLAAAIKGKPVVMLDVVPAHREHVAKAIQDSGLPIRAWWDPDRPGEPQRGRTSTPVPGPIHTAWDAERQRIFVIDARGGIRYVDPFGLGVLEKVVTKVLNELDGQPEPAAGDRR